jgi:hypothetical protein
MCSVYVPLVNDQLTLNMFGRLITAYYHSEPVLLSLGSARLCRPVIQL